MPFEWLKKQSKELAGVELNASNIKYVELGQSGQQQYVIDYLAIAQLPEKVIIDHDVKDLDAAGQAIHNIRTVTNTEQQNVASMVVGANVFSKVVKMHAQLSEIEMESQAWLDASQHFPELIDDVSLDFSVLGSADDPAFVNVMLVACRKQHVQSRVDAFLAGGFTPIVMDVDYYALARAFELIQAQIPSEAIDQNIALVNIGATMTTLVVMNNNDIIFTLDKEFNGMQFFTSYQTLLGNDNWVSALYDEAKPLNEDLQQQVNSMVQGALVPHLRHMIQFFLSGDHKGSLAQIVLSGEGALLPNIDAVVSQELTTPTIVANPAAYLQSGKHVNPVLLQQASPALMMSCGLSMRGASND